VAERDIFLGARECQGYVEPCSFGEGPGYYDDYPQVSFGMMFHGFDYPSESGVDELYARFWTPHMNYGVIDMISPEECTIRRFIRDMQSLEPQTTPLEMDESLRDLLEEGGLR